MFDMGTIAAALSSLKNAKDLAESLTDAKQALETDRVKAELLPLITQAYTQVLEARLAQADLADELREAKAQIAKMEEWKREAQRYRLQSIGADAYCYVLKPEAAGEEPPHGLCQNCYENQRKAVLQLARVENRYRILACPHCRAEVRFRTDNGEGLCFTDPSGGSRRML